MLNLFKDRLLLTKPVVIRGLTVRRDIQYEIRQCTGPDMIAEAVEGIKATLQIDWFVEERAARAIVYCRTKEQVDTLGAALGCPVYYSNSGTDEEKGQVLEAWLRGDGGEEGEEEEGGGGTRIVVATSAFGAGIDYPAVRAVFHVGEPDGAVGFAQEVGRGGRDGDGSISCMVLPRGWRAKTRDASGELLSRDAMAMQHYLDSPRCRLVPLSEFLDGVVQFCDQHQEVPCCDRCRELGLLSRDEAGDLARESGRRQQEEGAGEEIGGEGVLMLRASEQTEEQLRDEFISNLRMVEGKCVICCMMVEGGVRGGMGHSLSECRSVKKWEFFAVKKRAMACTGGWMAPYSGCYRCGLPQGICEKQGWEGCRYRDVVMPLSWAGFGCSDGGGSGGGGWWKVVEGLAGRKFSSEEEYMAWLGKGRKVFGEQGSNMAYIGAALLVKLVGRECAST
jgi:hypothetical protein